MIIRLASDIQSDSIVDGEGLRTVIWTQGCKHNCEGCQNPETHDFKGGFESSTEHVIQIISNLELQQGITFSGGDPFEQSEACSEIAKSAHSIGLDVWVYTGYTFEYITNSNLSSWNKFINEIDVLVDGKFIQVQKSLDLKFRGSKNQRIIDVKKSISNNKIILYKFFHLDI